MTEELKEHYHSEKDPRVQAARLFAAIGYVSAWLFFFYTIVDNNFIATPEVFIPLLIAGSFQTLPLAFLVFSGLPVSSGYFHTTGILLVLAAFTNIAAFASAVVAILGIRNAWSSRSTFVNSNPTQHPEIKKSSSDAAFYITCLVIGGVSFFWADDLVDFGRNQFRENLSTGSQGSPVKLPEEARKRIVMDSWKLNEIGSERLFTLELFNDSEWSVTSLDFRIEDKKTGDSRTFQAWVYNSQTDKRISAQPNRPFRAFGRLGQFIHDSNGSGRVVEIRGYK